MGRPRADAKAFLYENFYNSPGMEEAHQSRADCDRGIVRDADRRSTACFPSDHRAQIPTEGLARTVADYIAGMTDSYIEQALTVE